MTSRNRAFGLIITLACAAAPLACASDDVGDDATTGSASESASASSTSAASASASASASTTTGGGSASDASTADPSTSDGSASAGTTGDASDATSETATTGTTDATTGGPGVSGLEAFCDHYVECGGTYYEDAAACVNASLDYWGACPSRRAALDAFGACMTDLPCRDWSPDTYNPASTPCAGEWQDLGASTPCD